MTTTTKIYLAARYSRHPEMQGARDILKAMGHEVTSRWIDGDHDYRGDQSPADQRVQWAQEDWADLMAADWVISFTEEPGKAGGRNRGGRHVEFGAAMAAGKRLIVVGHRENVFHEMPEVEFYPSWPHLVLQLATEME